MSLHLELTLRPPKLYILLAPVFVRAQPPKTKAEVHDPEGYGFNNDSDDEEMIYEPVEYS